MATADLFAVAAPARGGLDLRRELPPMRRHFSTVDGGPLCGQRDIYGKAIARTLYTQDPASVTCRKCMRALGLAKQED